MIEAPALWPRSGLAPRCAKTRCLFAVDDRLVSFNGQQLSRSSSLEELLDAVEVGGKLSLEIARQR